MRRTALSLLAVSLLAGCGGGDRERARTAPDSPADVERDVEAAQERAAALPDVSSRPVRARRTPAEAIAAFQRAGFFRGADPAALAPRLARRHRREWGEPLRLRTIYDELVLTGYDRRRVWFEDTERDVLPGNDAYVAFLRDLRRISGGAFAPRGAAEEWAGEEGPVRLTFALDGRRRTVRAAPAGDFLDLCVLPQINRLIARRGRRFELFVPFDQTAYVVALTGSERARLEREHGWRFATPAQLRQAFALGQLYEEGESGRC
jgi:hypothetical protein